MPNILNNKRALIVGLASNRSIAAGIAQAFHEQGAELAFTYQNEKLSSRVTEIANKLNSSIILPCDVSKDEEINAVFAELEKIWPCVDIIIHSVAFAPADQLTGNYIDCVTREGFCS